MIYIIYIYIHMIYIIYIYVTYICICLHIYTLLTHMHYTYTCKYMHIHIYITQWHYIIEIPLMSRAWSILPMLSSAFIIDLVLSKGLWYTLSWLLYKMWAPDLISYMWLFNCHNTICWRDCLYFISCSQLYQKLIDN